MSPRLYHTAVIALVLSVLLSGCVIRIGEPEDPFERQEEVPPELRDNRGWPPIEDARIRPGTVVFGPAQRDDGRVGREQCTTNFVFGDPNNTTLYVGTGSHCVSGASIGDKILLAGGRAEGILEYCSFGTLTDTTSCPHVNATREEDRTNDFALIRVTDEYRPVVHPAVLIIGGPTGWAEAPDRGDTALLYGNSILREDDPDDPGTVEDEDAQAGRIWEQSGSDLFLTFPETLRRGDSGSPILDEDGAAMAVLLSKGWLRGCPEEEAQVHGAKPIAFLVEYMEENTDLRVFLHTWPLMDPPEPVPMPESVCDA